MVRHDKFTVMRFPLRIHLNLPSNPEVQFLTSYAYSAVMSQTVPLWSVSTGHDLEESARRLGQNGE